MYPKIHSGIFWGTSCILHNLFLPLPSSFSKQDLSSKEIITAEFPKSIHTEFIFPNVPKEKMIETLEENIQNNPKITKSTQEKMQQCQSWMEDYTSGDKVIFDYVPNQWTTITVKGVVKGTISGSDFMQALFFEARLETASPAHLNRL